MTRRPGVSIRRDEGHASRRQLQLELPDGATGADLAARDRARAWRRRRWRCGSTGRSGPRRAAAGRRAGRDRHRPQPGRARPDPPRRRARDGDGGDGALSGHQDLDRAADRERLLLRLRVPRGREGHRRGPRADRGADARARRGRRAVRAHRRARSTRREQRFAERGPGLQGRADPRPASRTRASRPCRCTATGPFTDLCRGPARALDRAHQGVQAAVARGRLLARRRAQQDADPHLRHRVLLEEGPRAPPRAARAGARPRPPPPRAAARAVPAARRSRPACRSSCRTAWWS